MPSWLRSSSIGFRISSYHGKGLSLYCFDAMCLALVHCFCAFQSRVEWGVNTWQQEAQFIRWSHLLAAWRIFSFQENGTLFLSRPDSDAGTRFIISCFRDAAARNKSVTWVILVTAYRLCDTRYPCRKLTTISIFESILWKFKGIEFNIACFSVNQESRSRELRTGAWTRTLLGIRSTQVQ